MMAVEVASLTAAVTVQRETNTPRFVMMDDDLAMLDNGGVLPLPLYLFKMSHRECRRAVWPVGKTCLL